MTALPVTPCRTDALQPGVLVTDRQVSCGAFE